MPEFAHFPLLRNPDRSQDQQAQEPGGPAALVRAEGFLPEALLNFLGLLGFSMPDGREKFAFDEMAESFELDRINTVGPVFESQAQPADGRYVRELDDDESSAISRTGCRPG